ncbi:hypothetical protein LSH36_705g01032 [Paralvinella palmiformis]|uniref:Ig-like domain-containing protein n=1 Tax=Paralvinella palmiformis TaxID=53620 RepID=A0AAD9J1Y4_9ANNE|nr:hypothetical protein LSH36_705g01032 [Paralvinella palmiformis]
MSRSLKTLENVTEKSDSDKYDTSFSSSFIQSYNSYGNNTDNKEQQRQNGLVPPVIYNQTLGPVYIKDSKQYTRIYCEASKGANVSWEYQGLNISDLNIQNYVRQKEGIQFQLEDGGRILVIYDHQHKAISGYVQCFVTNEMGATFGDKVFVAHTVLGFLEGGARRTDIIAIEGDHVTLSCERHIETEPAADVLWFFGSEIIHPLTRPNFFCNEHMTMCVISALTKADSGVYKCNYNIPGMHKEIYKAFILQVMESNLNPSAVHPLNLMDHISSPSLVEAEKDSDVKLQCAFRGDRAHQVRWRYALGDTSSCDVGALSVINATGNMLLEQNGTALHIMALTPNVEGYYECMADNGYDRYVHRIQLRIIAPPVLVDKVYGEEAYLGGTVRFNCSVLEAIPAATTSWWVNMNRVLASGFGRFHTEEDGRILVLDDAALDDTSSITCNVSNRVGSVLGHRYVSVKNITVTTQGPQKVTTIWNNKKMNVTDTSSNIMTENSTNWTSSSSATTGQMSAITENKLTSAIYDKMMAAVTDVTSDHVTDVTTNMDHMIVRNPLDGTTEKYNIPQSDLTEKYNVNDKSNHSYGVEAEPNRLDGARYDARRDPVQNASSGHSSVTMSVTLGLLGLIVGFAIGFLVTWCVMRRRVKRQHNIEATGTVHAEVAAPISRSPIHKLHLDCKTSTSETMSMIHEGSVLETIT